MKSRALAARYARALASSVKETEEVERTASDLQTLTAVIRDNPKLADLFVNPAVSAETRGRLAKDISQAANLAPKTARFLTVLIEGDRFDLIEDVTTIFLEIRDERLGFVAAEVTTAGALDAQQEKDWLAKLGAMTGRKVRLTKTIDPAIIGGAIARIGSKVYDGSLRSRLSGLREQLLGN